MSTSKKQLLGFFLAIIVLIAIGLAITFLARGRFLPQPQEIIQDVLQPEVVVEEGIGSQPGEFEEFEEFEKLEDPVEKENVIVSLVEIEAGQMVSKAAFYLTENLFDAVISVNGQPDGWQVVRDNNLRYVELSFPAEYQSHDMTISFIKDGNILSTCKIVVAETINLSGDCNW